MASTKQSPSWLLLLPFPPNPVTLVKLRSAFGHSLTEFLQEVSQVTKSTSINQVVDIALASTGIWDREPRSTQYHNLQKLVAQLYTLLCLIFTEQKIDLNNGNDVDARIILLEKDADNETLAAQTPEGYSAELLTSQSNLQFLATCPRQYEHISSVKSEEGAFLLKLFFQCRKNTDHRVFQTSNTAKSQLTSYTKNPEKTREQETTLRRNLPTRHFSVAVGGTFDHIHSGHKLLLTMTALILEPYDPAEPNRKRALTIGITGDQLLKKKQYADELQDWNLRQENVHNFLSAVLLLDSPQLALLATERTRNSDTGARMVRHDFRTGLVISYAEIFDPFGPTITDEEISALVVSAETRSGGKAVNDRRSEKGWATLEVFEVDVLNAGEDDNASGQTALEQDFQNKISSTAIRQKIHLRPGHAP